MIACGRKGKYFKITGRIKNAELEVAAILIAMETKIHNLTNLTNINLDTEELKKLNSLEVFSSITCNWLSDLSIFIKKILEQKKFQMLQLLLFIVKTNISKLKANHYNPDSVVP